jgi:hypothetical protein
MLGTNVARRVELRRSKLLSGTVGPVQVFGRRHHARRHALRRPASKKRQGTKSREVWRWVGSQRYGDLIFAPIMTVGAKLALGDLDRVRKGSWKRAMGISVAA